MSPRSMIDNAFDLLLRTFRTCRPSIGGILLLTLLTFVLPYVILWALEIETKKGNKLAHQHLLEEDFTAGTVEVEKVTAEGETKKESLIIDVPKSKEKLVEQAEKQGFEKIKEPTFSYNCHGLTFAQGSIWLFDVRKILDDQGWKPAKDENDKPINSQNNQGAKKGDILIYGTNVGEEGERIVHSAIVEKVDDNGKILKVRSKLGEGIEGIHGPSFEGIEDKIKKKYNDLYGEWTVFRGGEALKVPDEEEDKSKGRAFTEFPDTCGSMAPDSDLDALPDLKEIFWETDERDPDTDDDTFSDGIEVRAGSDPLDPVSVPAAFLIPTLSTQSLAVFAGLLLLACLLVLRRHLR